MFSVEVFPDLSQIIFGGNPFNTEISMKSESNVTIQYSCRLA